MVLVLGVFLDFVMFNVVCISPGPNVDLHVIEGRTVHTQEFRQLGKKLVFINNDLKLRLVVFCHTCMIFYFSGTIVG